MDILAASVWLRYLEAGGASLPRFPANGYRGDYIRRIADELHARHGAALSVPAGELFEGLPADAPDGDKEAHIDALVGRLRELGGESSYRTVFEAALNAILEDIRDDLEAFGVRFERWFMESSLTESGMVDTCLEKLKADGLVYEKDGALWFRSTDFGDEKDRVVRRDNGQPTYFASDIAYHLDKIERGYDRLIDIWGADHHGYIGRVRAAMQALGLPEDRLDIQLVQFAILYRGKEKLPMSTRSGEFVTLRELRGEVGDDAARFFYIMRRSEQHMDFDLELAKSQSNDNPVYYVQYAHAGIASVFKQLQENREAFSAYSREQGLAERARLNEPHETALLKTLSRYPEVVEDAAGAAEPHQLTYYLRELANEFHSYYNAHPFLVEDTGLRNARLALVEACGQVLRNALSLIGVSAPDSM
jgi:arginyl-tRNA synthetase